MITVPGPVCAFDGLACNIPGFGFLVVESTETECAINDYPCTGKNGKCPTLAELTNDEWTGADAGPLGGYIGDITAPAAVPLPASGFLLLAVIFGTAAMKHLSKRRS